jgi:alkylation response protein AidB-like acyl-CoA dehydrogenase
MRTMTTTLSTDAITRAGSDLVALAGWLADCVADHERLDVLLDTGFLSAPIPEHLGGLGVASVHDMALALSVLSAADAPLAGDVAAHWLALLTGESA